MSMKIELSFLAASKRCSVLLYWPLISSAIIPEEMPIGLQHLGSDPCWCDPLIETDGDGEKAVIHRQVTWKAHRAKL